MLKHQYNGLLAFSEQPCYRTEQECKMETVYNCNPSAGSGLDPGADCGWKTEKVCHTVYVCR